MTGQVSIYFTIGCFTSLSKTKIMQQLLLEKLLVRALHFDWLIALVKQKTHFLPFIVLHLKCFNYIFYNIFNIFMYLWYLNSPPPSLQFFAGMSGYVSIPNKNLIISIFHFLYAYLHAKNQSDPNFFLNYCLSKNPAI